MAIRKRNTKKDTNLLPLLLLAGAGVALYLYYNSQKKFVVIPGEMSPPVFNPKAILNEREFLTLPGDDILLSTSPLPTNNFNNQNFDYFQEMRINQISGNSQNALCNIPLVS